MRHCQCLNSQNDFIFLILLLLILLLGFQRSSSRLDSRRLPRQGSSFESVGGGDYGETPNAPVQSIPIRHVPSPSSSSSASTTTVVNKPHPPSGQTSTGPKQTTSNNDLPLQQLIQDMSVSDTLSLATDSRHPSSLPLQLHENHSPSSSSSSSSNGTSTVINVEQATPTGQDNQVQFHMECQLVNSITKQVIKSSQTCQSNIKSPVYRDIKIKKLTKYSNVPPLTPLTVAVTVNQSCYLYIINIGSSGNLTTLIPNEHDEDNRAVPGQSVQFPPEGAEYEFELDSNTGTEIVVVLAYSSNITVEDAESECKRMRNSSTVTVERDIKIKKKAVLPIGTVEMQFSVKC